MISFWGSGKQNPKPWRGALVVAGIEQLTPSVKRFRLHTPHKQRPFNFEAGQYVKLALSVSGGEVERPYSISSNPDERDHIDISVKRERYGRGSGHLHDAVRVGDRLHLSGPYGDFTCDPDADLKGGALLLVAGGIGMTPMLSLLQAAAGRRHLGPITLLASFRSASEHLFRDELERLSGLLPGFRFRAFVTNGDATRRIGVEALRDRAPEAQRIHVCGPTAMQYSVICALQDLGVARDVVRTEAFSSNLDAERALTMALGAHAAHIQSYAVTLNGEARFACVPGQTLLDAGLSAGAPMRFWCRQARCGTCRVQVAAGQCDSGASDLLSASERRSGWVLACQTMAASDLELISAS